MYWLDNIEKYIEHYGSPAVQQRGRTLFNIGGVRSIDYDTNENTGEAEVISGDTFKVEIAQGVNSDFRNIQTSCTCEYDKGVCKHQVAALLGLKKKFQYNSAAIMGIINKTNTLHNSSKELDITSELLSKYSIEAQFSPRIRQASEIVLKYETIRPEILSFKVGELSTSWGRDKYDYQDVDVLITAERVTSRCSCNKQVIDLCLHQQKVIHHISFDLGQAELLLQFPDVEQLKQAAVDDYGLVSVDDVDTFFTLTLTVNGPEYVPKDKELVSFSDHLFLVKKLQQISDITRYDAITGESGVESNLQGLALFLEESDDSIPVRLHVISGKSNKGSDRIISNVSSVEDPSEVNAALRSPYLEYEKIKSLYNSQFPDANHPKLINYFLKYQETFNEVPLYLMKEKFNFRRTDIKKVLIAEELVELKLKVKANNAQYIIEAFIKMGSVEIPVSKFEGVVNTIFVLFGGILYLMPDIRTSKLLFVLMERPLLKYSGKAKNSFFEQIRTFSQVATVESVGEQVVIQDLEVGLDQMAIELSESGEHLIVQPKVKYSNGLYYIPTIDREDIQGEEVLHRIKRDGAAEEDFMATLALFDEEWAKQRHLGFYYKHLDNVVNTPWIFTLYALCKEKGILIEGYENLETLNYNPNQASINIALSTGIDWFEGELDVTYGEQTVELKELRNAILANETTVRLADGTRGMLPEEWIERLSTIFKNSEIEDGKLLISKMKFNIIDMLFEEVNDEQLKLEIDYRKRRLLDFDKIEEIPLPTTITAELRPYQKQGFYWMKFLDDFGFGGCIADDMGLGKTLQVLTFLAYKKEQGGESNNLIVLPKSLIFNWIDEVAKFCPTLTVMVYHGSKRKLELKNFEKYDLVLSTYGTITNDIEEIKEKHFSYVILDESQAIKNPNSKRYKAMRLLRADNRMVMTGTPIENQTFDLYAQFNFINPGFFGSAGQFRLNYAEPIDVYSNEAVSTELKRLVKPFLLRRTKEQVAKDLPPKTESVIYCDMTEKQRVIYNAFLQKYKDYVSQKISENGLQRSKMFVIEALLKLRQICNSPALLNETETYPNESVKIDLLMEHLGELMQNHKVLVISQFTSMLALIRERIEAAQIPYSYLDGGTTKRKEEVDEFNGDPSKRVFLLSLKAGGVGLNLATADYVFLVDPWWNPAAESQAIDRAHRIGQEKHVFAYRMICKDSIEEKIQQLQQRKRKVAKDIIQVEESFMKSLQQDDIMALFS